MVMNWATSASLRDECPARFTAYAVRLTSAAPDDWHVAGQKWHWDHGAARLDHQSVDLIQGDGGEDL